MRILHLHTELNRVCGITKMIWNIISSIGQDYKNEIFTRGGNNIDLFLENGITVHVSAKNKYLPVLAEVYDLRNILSKNDYDIIHSHDRFFDYLLSKIGKADPHKIITSVHSKVYGKKLFSYKANRLIVPNICMRNHLNEKFGISGNRITVICNFVTLPIYQSDNKIRNKNSVNILFAGRFCEEKGVDILLKSFRTVQNNYPLARLTLVGSGSLEEKIRTFIYENKINAVILPPVQDLSSYYKSADIFVLPSRNDPFPLVMLEAGAFAKPFVGSSVDGIAEFIEDNKNGILVEPENTSMLAQSLSNLIEDTRHAQSMGNHLKQKVEKYCTAQSVMPIYRTLYDEVYYERKYD